MLDCRGMGRRSPPGIPWDALLAWYRANKREMPWRGSRDPYAVWLSETMLQQTRIETVRGYFARFLARFPDVRALAAAPLPAVLKLWEGLGYYSRARNLHAAAKRVAEAGAFPRDAAGWAELPGVGRLPMPRQSITRAVRPQGIARRGGLWHNVRPCDAKSAICTTPPAP